MRFRIGQLINTPRTYAVRLTSGAFVGLLICCLWCTSGFARKWRDTSGKFEVEAELVAVSGGSVQLRKEDGSIISVELDRLSEADQAFLTNHLRKEANRGDKEKPVPMAPAILEGFQVTDCFVQTSLPAGTGIGGAEYEIVPKKPGFKYLMVIVTVPNHLLQPSDEEWRSIEKDFRARKAEIPSRSTIRVFSPQRFILIGRTVKLKGTLIAEYAITEGRPATFASEIQQYGKADIDPSALQTLAVAWDLPERAFHPPLRVSYDRYAPVDITLPAATGFAAP